MGVTVNQGKLMVLLIVLGCSLCSIRGNIDKIKSSMNYSGSHSAKITSRMRNLAIEKVEMLAIWVEDQSQSL